MELQRKSKFTARVQVVMNYQITPRPGTESNRIQHQEPHRSPSLALTMATFCSAHSRALLSIGSGAPEHQDPCAGDWNTSPLQGEMQLTDGGRVGGGGRGPCTAVPSLKLEAAENSNLCVWFFQGCPGCVTSDQQKTVQGG